MYANETEIHQQKAVDYIAKVYITLSIFSIFNALLLVCPE